MMNTIKIEENILYEDKDVVVCCKPAGFPVQTRKPGCMDMESALRNYLAGKGQGTYLAVIHRLDQPVQGILVFAKIKEAQQTSVSRYSRGKWRRNIWLMCRESRKKKKGRLVNEMEKDSRTNTSRVVEKKTSSSKRAELDYCVLKETEEGSLVEIHLHTGRHHQIRVQMAYAGMPLFGDTKYNLEEKEKDQWQQIALCAYKLSFFHPATKKKWNFR